MKSNWYIFLLLPVLLVSCPRSHCQIQCYEDFAHVFFYEFYSSSSKNNCSGSNQPSYPHPHLPPHRIWGPSPPPAASYVLSRPCSILIRSMNTEVLRFSPHSGHMWHTYLLDTQAACLCGSASGIRGQDRRSVSFILICELAFFFFLISKPQLTISWPQ